MDLEILLVLLLRKFSSYRKIFCTNNKIFVIDKYGNKKMRKKIKNLNIKFEGTNNTITIDKSANLNTSVIFISGSNNELVKGKNCKFYSDVKIDMCGNKNNRKFIIDENVSISGAFMHCWGDNSSFHIGKNCMLSYGIDIMCGDGHPIFDKNTNERINYGNFIEIGEHCWIGAGVTITKNVKLAPGTIVGTQSVITKSVDEPDCIVAGNPQRIIKKNVSWAKDCV